MRLHTATLFRSTLLLWGVLATSPFAHAQTDPGPRRGPAGAGRPLAGLDANQIAYFQAGLDRFREVDSVQGAEPGAEGSGLGPRFNMNSCAGCHSHPVDGGSSPAINPQIAMATRFGARNTVPQFLRPDGPVRVARFVRHADGSPDGGVHDLFVITGRSDAPGCNITQPDFAAAGQRNNLSLRIPTPIFGTGLIEAIPDATILENLNANQQAKRQLGIRGRLNHNGNDGTVTRFGWKAQNKSLLLFSGEAYNVEQGVTNELFPNERDDEPVPLPQACKSNPTPEDDTQFAVLDMPSRMTSESAAAGFAAVAGDLVKFELFMRMLAPPRPACDPEQSGNCAPSVARGSQVFDQVYCSACHVRQLKIGAASIEAISAQQNAHLYSDLLLHKMGSCLPNADHTAKCLADGIAQGEARGDEFRTAPLWGLGQRVFFLHDGRARDLPTAILAHRGPGSEANTVVRYYEKLPDSSKQDLIDFLRSL